jgi:hypothetical protein
MVHPSHNERLSVADKVHIPQVFEAEEKLPADLVALRRFAFLMDQAFAIPGTRIRVGLDAVLGLIPGIGDIVGALMSTWIIAGALRYRVRMRTIVRMVLNVAADLLFGAIPVAGDVFDFLYDANVKNMALLEAHRDRRRPPRSLARIAFAFSLVVFAILSVFFGIIVALVVLLPRMRWWP